MSTVLPFSQANKKLVCSMYRRSCKLARNWITRPDHLRAEQMQIRKQFDMNKNISDIAELQMVLQKTEALIYEFRHPDPVTPPARPGGTKYQRYIAPSYETPFPVDNI
ncbi:hypothetical protein BABINDRAFT_161382 [Babjeviella inositovora NRRL Y-12698]|uniref:NADH dehydrogenase [ubiquinone] 1 beta subcomplex subunit 9 n=1 Tax=Babjeviella inositovora NRRL Y-12698 TaxID=984486 RepID=A0A1E3QRW7_9ASCO|nr:uncharacterized protein BABINDRAFT_161382 [Babjeviella inositovora NRRL Y-12698]ODQ80443.1 hypothetical protein BABINDRAFT_161382 [Babjeviella inositovora NRRL Y-12698]